ncbi:hypothetical protein K2P97_12165 [bacterium]|nr:hypothetical protein [bacterium]
MKSIHYVFILVLAAAIFFVEYDLSRRTEKLAIANKKNQTKPVADTNLTPVQPVVIDQGENAAILKNFIGKFKQEAVQMAQLQNDPEAVQVRLMALAKEMSSSDVQSLYELISDDKKDGDQRALAIELLSLKNDTASMLALQNFVGNNKNVNGNKWDRKKELETVLRAQAVEGIASFPQKDIAISTLGFLQSKVDEKFLSDRISRAAAGLNNLAPSLQQQDEEALKNLLE